MGISDRNLRAISYFAVFCGVVSLFKEESVFMLFAWAIATMIALFRSLFTHTERYKEDGSQFFLEVFDGLLATIALLMMICGFIGFGMSGPVWASTLWAIGFIALQARILFTQAPRTER